MKLKVMPILAGSVAIALAATPLAVIAQPSQSSPPSSSQTQNQSPLTNVKLTQQQQDKLAQIRSDTRTQLDKILTPKQKDQFRAALQAGQDRRSAFAAMNLSDQQKTQLRTLMQSAKSRAEAVLTPEQRQQIQKDLQLRQRQ